MEVASAVASVLVAWVKLSEKTFELKAVETQARAVLQTVTHVQNQLDSARKLRRQKSSFFTALEKSTFDDTFAYTEEAAAQVATLTERVRADMEVLEGKAGMNSRILFVLRDSPNIHVSLTKLSIAAQSLNTVIVSVNNREGSSAVNQQGIGDHSTTSHAGPNKAPPTYTEAMFFAEVRSRNLRKRASLHGSTSSKIRDKRSLSLSMSPGSGITESHESANRSAPFRDFEMTISENEHGDEEQEESEDEDNMNCGVPLPVSLTATTSANAPWLNAPPSVALLHTPPPEPPRVRHRGRERAHRWLQQYTDNSLSWRAREP